MSCEADKLAIKIGGCFKQNNDPDEDAKSPCLDPCNRPSEPTTNCPFGGTPRFENWDYISGRTFVSPRCGEQAPLFICGGNYEKYRAGMRVTVLGIGSYLVTAVLPDRLIIKNTGNSPDGVSFPNNGSLQLAIGNHDGHWNDAECDQLEEYDQGDIYLTNVAPSPEDCCAQSRTRCKCRGILKQGIGFLKSVVEGGRKVYKWVQDVFPCEYPSGGTLQPNDQILVCRAGNPLLVNAQLNSIIAYVEFQGGLQQLNVNKSLNFIGFTPPPGGALAIANFNTGSISASNVLAMGSGFFTASYGAPGNTSQTMRPLLFQNPSTAAGTTTVYIFGDLPSPLQNFSMQGTIILFKV